MRRMLLTLAISAALGGCDTPTAGGGGGIAPVTMTGTWTIAYRLTPTVGAVGFSLDGYLHLEQQGTSLTGSYARDRNPTAYPVSGTIVGRVVNLTVGPVGVAVGTTVVVSNQATIDSTGGFGTGPASASVQAGAASLPLTGMADVSRLPQNPS